jgi:hypothetical protein
MALPPKPVDIAFEELLQALPPDYQALAFEFKAFTRSRKIKTPAQLLQVVMVLSYMVAPGLPSTCATRRLTASD